MKVIAMALLLTACAHAERRSTVPPVLTDRAQLDAHVGQVVTLRGVVSRTKIPTILGVDVDDSDLADQPAEATGRLEREEVTQQEIEARIAEHGQFAHRGAGVFYRLVAEDGEGLARPRRLR